MISVEKALDIILKNVKKIDIEKILIKDAFNRIIAENIASDQNIPSFDNSAMDGYAVRSENTDGSSKQTPVLLEVIGLLRAGDSLDKKLSSGQAIQIMTGAPVPEGADSVVMVEDTSLNNKQVEIFKEVKKSENIRKSGNDIKVGDLVIKKGSKLSPQHVGMLASLGITEIHVFKRPKIAVISTGDELLKVDEALSPGKIRCSSSYALFGQIMEAGGIPVDLGIVKDNIKDLKKRIIKGLQGDMLITTGGVSMGAYDHVRDVLRGLGAEIKFWKVAMKPGKPFMFSILDDTSVFSLAGNPVSSMINFEILVKPALYKMLGSNERPFTEVEGTIEQDVVKEDRRKHYIRAITNWKNGRFCAIPTGPQDSNILRSMVMANSLIVVPEEQSFVGQGQTVKILMI